MADYVNDRVNETQELLQQRAERLKKLVKAAEGKRVSDEFTRGADLLARLIKSESETIDMAVFEQPRTRLEQMRNLQLTTGGTSQTPAEYMKNFTRSMDTMLDALEEMIR